MSKQYLALVHYPVHNKLGEVVTTSVTNFDLHDLARTCTTYGIEKCFIVTPNESQQNMVDYIKKYWREGWGADYNPDRKEAFDCLEVSNSLEETRLTIENLNGKRPRLVATTARRNENSFSFNGLRAEMKRDGESYLFVFGTGWGLTEDILKSCDIILEPIVGPTPYNHLPVRSAVAIVLDRLLADWVKE